MKFIKQTRAPRTRAAITRLAGYQAQAVSAGLRGVSAHGVVRLTMVLSLLIVSSSWQAAHGSVVFSNLGPGDSYDSPGFVLNGDQAFATFPHDLDIASRFQVSPSTSYIFDSVEIVFANVGGSNIARLHLFSDKAGQPDQPLETIHLTDLPTDPVFSPPLTTALSAQNPTLQAGGTYWLAVDVSGDTAVRWNQNNQGALGFATREDGGPWEPIFTPPPNGAFRINGTLIPEPSTALLIVIGMTIGFARGSRCPRDQRISSPQV